MITTTRLNSRRRASVQALLHYFITRDRKIFWPDDSARISLATGLQEWQIGEALDALEALGCAEMTFTGARTVIRLKSAAATPAVPVVESSSTISRRQRRARA